VAASVIFEERIRIPMDMDSLDAFRNWVLSDSFPESGRIDFIDGNIEVDMSPEDLFSHGTLKTEICHRVAGRVKELNLGHLFVDSTRVTHPAEQFSVEPDLVVVSHQAIESGKIRLVPKQGAGADRFVEIEGAPDLIVEIASDSSQVKDRKRLFDAYCRAGVMEYWLVDGRGEEIDFQIHHYDLSGFAEAACNELGLIDSIVLRCGCRLERDRGPGGFWNYDLHLRADSQTQQ